MNLTAEQALRVMTTSVIDVKKIQCARNGGPTDLCPMVHLIFDDGTHELALLMADREVIPDLVRSYRTGTRREAFVAMIADGYHREVPVGVHEGQRGDITRAFRDGDMTVTEVLTVMMLDVSTGTMHETHVSYTYRDDGTPKFAKPQSFMQSETERVEGRIPELLRMSVSA